MNKIDSGSRIQTALLDNFPHCSAMILKKHTREIVASNKFAQGKGAIPGQKCFATCALRDDSCPFCLAPKLWKSNEPQSIEVEYQGRWYDRRWAPLSEDLYVHYVFDITERKHAEEELRKSEAHLQSVFRAAPIGVGVVVDRMFTQVNKRMCEMTGYSNEELVGQNARMLYMCDDDYEHVGREKYRQICDLGTGTVETRWKCKAGHIIDVLLSSTPIETSGPSKEVVFTALDITERKQGEKELVKHREQLELLVDVRTRKLKEAQSELIQGERLATLGRLTATVSHEIRNPLGTIQTAIFSIGDSLERNELHRVERSLELAERSIIRCVNIIEDLTNYTRVKKLNTTKTSLDDWLKTVLDEQAILEDVCCEFELASGICAQIDQEKLRQVIINLITNAVHALLAKKSNGKLLQISTHLFDDEYEIRVRDNGIGMSDETRGKVFEPLFSTKGFGVGLGMVIAKDIVEQHHGEISIESMDGKGTTVTLRLPIRPPEGEAQ